MNRQRSRQGGFTLIELLIVLAIIAILGALAYPGYGAYITRARRVEGQVALLEALQQQELFYTRNNTYVAFSSGSTDPQERRFKWWSGSAAASSAYELQARACPGLALTQCVEVQAMPGTERVNARFRDAACATLTLNSAGERGAGGPLGQCWP